MRDATYTTTVILLAGLTALSLPLRPWERSSPFPASRSWWPAPPARHFKDRALRELEAGRLWKPNREQLEEAAFPLAPLLLEEALLAEGEETVALANGDLGRPTVFHRETTALLGGQPYQQMAYMWFYPRGEGLAAQGIRMTLDAKGLAVLWEVLADSAERQLVFVATTVEEKARLHFGAPLPGREHALARSEEETPDVVIARVIRPGPMPMGPFVYLESKTRNVLTVICRCMPSQVRDIVQNGVFRLQPLSATREERSAEALRGFFGPETGDPSWLERCLRLPPEL